MNILCVIRRLAAVEVTFIPLLFQVSLLRRRIRNVLLRSDRRVTVQVFNHFRLCFDCDDNNL